jgi:NAD(P)-dependent dehydrogenase (short-subunit alcohol dehydrogenase family)
VTGASSGIGNAVARKLAATGFAVALWDIDEAGAVEAAAGLVAAGGVAMASRVDVSDHESVGAALAQCRETLGTPTAAVAAAGIMSVRPFLDLPVDTWDRTLRVNLTGTFLLLQACGAAMVADDVVGAMVCVASVAARGPRADAADYAASKAGVLSVTRSAAVALGPHGIRVNAVCPGVVDTVMTARNARDRAEREGTTPEEVLSALVARVPLGRLAAAEEVAEVVARLLDAEFGYVTGQAINVCGGLEFD